VPLLLVSFPVLIWLLDGLGPAHTRPLMAGVIGWAFGFGFFAIGLYWVGNAFLVDAAQFGALMPGAVLAMCAGLALFPGVAIGVARLIAPAGAERVIVIALAWAADEWIRGHVLTGFPWNLIGYTWGATLPVLQATALVGSYGLSILTLVAVASPAALVAFSGGKARPAPRNAGLLPLGALAVFAVIFTYGQVRLAGGPAPLVPGVHLRLVQPSVPQIDKITPGNAQRIFEKHMALTMRPGLDKATIVIWAEAAVPTLLADDKSALQAIGEVLGPHQWLITGSARYEPPEGGHDARYYNSMLVIDTEGRVRAVYDKHHLVPFGEYLPLKPLLSAIGLRQLVESEEGFTPGPHLRTLHVPGLPAIGPLICYEAIFPGEVVQPGHRPAWLLNITDDTWFGHGAGPRQHFESARIRAVEEGLPLVRDGNNGISAVIDAKGRILKRLGLDKVGVLDSPLPQAGPPTLYARLGAAAYWAVFVLFAALAFAWNRLRRR
jgi:apolipoprotein N-acyltransferase